MRFFSSNRNNEPQGDNSDPNHDPNLEEPTDPSGNEPEPEPSGSLEEWTLPEGATLDSLYDGDGESLFVDEQGNPVDEQGNPIPASRQEAEGFVQPAAPTPPAEPTAPKPPAALRSPMADGLLTQEEVAALEAEGYDTKSINAMMLLASRVADRKISAYEQQRFAGQGLVDDETRAELAPRIARVRNLVPDSLRGTRQGDMTELALAALDEAMETGDFTGAFSRFAPRQDNAPAPRAPGLTPPAARMPSPRPNQGVRPFARRGQPTDVANESFHKDCLDGDVIATLQRERKVAHF